MSFAHLLLEQEDGIAVITINRPEALNAIDDATIAELHACFDAQFADPTIRVIILTGSGDKAFVAGADIKEINATNGETGSAKIRKGQAMMLNIERGSKPVIAAINGFALGGGCELAMVCDIRVASERAVLGQPEANLGLIPGYGSTQRLPRLVGPGMARWLIYSGERINAQEALRIGLVDFVVPPEELMPRVRKMAATIASKAPLATMYAKRCMVYGNEAPIVSGCEYEAGYFGLACASEDCHEGCNAFTERRKPVWQGK